MAFTPRPRAQIEAELLADLAARFAANGEDLLTVPGSDMQLLAAAVAVDHEALEAQADAVAKNILPDTADSTTLDRHGAVEGLARDPAVAAVVTLAITGGPVSTTTPLAGQTVQSDAGELYDLIDGTGAAVTELTTNGSGTVTTPATLRAKCRTPGTAGNLAAGASLTWSSAPTGYAGSDVAVTALSTTGAPAESDAAYALRILARRQNRPASGNREDWRDWARRYAGVEEAYVYPLLSGTDVGTLGCVTVVPLGPAQGDSTTATRILDTDTCDAIAAFIEGTGDAEGNSVVNGVQLRPVTMAAADYAIEPADTQSQHLDLQLTNNAAFAFPFTSPARLAKTGGSTTTVVVSGDYTALNGKNVLVFCGTAYVRGGFVARQITGAVYGGGSTTFTLDSAMPGSAANDTAGYCLYPAPPNWSVLRTAVFDLFDGLGPGDAAAPSSRYPEESVQAGATLYRSALVATLKAASPGLLDVEVTTPSSNVTPAAKTLVTLGQLIIRQA